MMMYKNNPAVHAQVSGTPGSKIQLNIFKPLPISKNGKPFRWFVQAV
jgi:hypothetical protein